MSEYFTSDAIPKGTIVVDSVQDAYPHLKTPRTVNIKLALHPDLEPLPDTDVIIIRLRRGHTPEGLDAIQRLVNDELTPRRPDTLFLIADSDTTITSMSEADMAAHGWQRIPQDNPSVA